MSDRQPIEIDARTGEIEYLPPQRGKRYRCRLDTLQDVKHEMSKVYRETRSNMLDAQTATKLVWILSSIGKTIEQSDLEQRVARLEQGRQPILTNETDEE